MSGDHGPRGGAASALDQRARQLVIGAAVVVGLVVIVGLVALWPSGDDRGGGTVPTVEATIERITTVTCASGQGSCQRIASRIDDGRVGEFEFPVGFGRLEFDEGDPILLSELPGPDGEPIYQFLDFQRSTPMLMLLLLFVAAVLVLGRWRGVGALAGLAASLGVLGWFLLPALVDGRSELAVALTGAGAVAFVALYLAHGVSVRTTVALLGTLAALSVTAVLALVFVAAARLTGTTDDVAQVIELAPGVSLRGLVLAGLVIGALGVLDDVCVTQVSAVWELRAANPSFGALALWRAGLRIGRDHVASTVNTLVIAYAGASLPLLLLFSQTGQAWSSVVTQELVAVEVVRALVGSIGIVAAVPLTTGLAAVLAATIAPTANGDESVTVMPEPSPLEPRGDVDILRR